MSAARTNEPAVLPAVTIIVTRPIGAGRYQALVGGRVLGASTPAEPARRRRGRCLPRAPIRICPLVMRHAGSGGARARSTKSRRTMQMIDFWIVRKGENPWKVAPEVSDGI